jgi:hypothetical protein
MSHRCKTKRCATTTNSQQNGTLENLCFYTTTANQWIFFFSNLQPTFINVIHIPDRETV